MYFRINEALSWLFDQKFDKEEQTSRAKAVLDLGDWSAINPIVELALSCVRRDFSKIHELAKRANEAGLEYKDARTFVVFREARQIEGFLDCFPKRSFENVPPS